MIFYSPENQKKQQAELHDRTGHRPITWCEPQHRPGHSKKHARRIEANGFVFVAAPKDDVVEFDEVCMRLTPSLWLWTAVSRLVGQVLGFVFEDRSNGSDAALALAWSDVPRDYRDKPIFTDHWGAYGRFFPAEQAEQHEACDKGSGVAGRPAL